MISIITPAYQSVAYLPLCIESVAAQYQDGMEHLIVDGGSTDGTLEILNEYAARYPHIRWVSEKDRGQSHAMNKGLGMARNPVVSFLNADDRYEPGALEFAQHFFAQAKPNTFLVGDCRVLKADGSQYMINRPCPFQAASFILDYNFPYNPSAYFYHKSIHQLVGPYDEEDHLTMDIDFIFRMMQVAHIVYVPRILGQYVMVENSKTMKEISAGRNVENLIKVFTRYEPGLPLREKIRLFIWRKMGSHRGWMLHYWRHPDQFFKKLFGK